jgi:predicted small lipoprotein YifL
VKSLLYALLLLSGCACSQKTPEYTPDEASCLAVAEYNYRLKRSACGANVEGQCSTDSLIDAQKKEASECF